MNLLMHSPLFIFSYLPAPVVGSIPGVIGLHSDAAKGEASQSLTPPLTQSQLVWGEYRDMRFSSKNETIRSFHDLDEKNALIKDIYKNNTITGIFSGKAYLLV